MRYRVVVYMRIDPEDEELFDTKEEAESETANLDLMQPEDHHEIEEVEEDAPAQ
jgi:hypothetical protein